MKRMMSLILSILVLASVLILPAGAAAQSAPSTMVWIEEYGDLQVETILTVYDSLRSSSRTAEKTKKVYSSGNLIATVTLKATFGYDGSEAWVISASASKSTSGGWSYGGQSIDKDGGTATLTAELSKYPYSDIPVEISMTCSPSGKIS